MPDVTLLPRVLARAQTLNPIYEQRLGWRVPHGWPTDVASAAFALEVARFQSEHGELVVDGALGPKTWAALRGRSYAPPARDHLVIGGARVPVPFPVVTWHEPCGLSFRDIGGWRRRREPSGKAIDLLVFHWDGCLSAHQCFQVLVERGLSAHLLLDGDGTVYQTLDLAEASAWHAGAANERSIGVEIQNPVRLHRQRWQTPLRDTVVEPRVHATGTWEHLDFYDIQKQRAVELAEVLCAHLGIPRALPMRDGQVITRLAPHDFRGVCGHYHLSRTKLDPGLTLWPRLQRAFRTLKP